MSREEEEHVNLGIMSRTIRILHVDDEPADLEITRILIKREAKRDFEIVGVLSAKEALKRLETEHFDAIIADYKMPEMDGIELRSYPEIVRTIRDSGLDNEIINNSLRIFELIADAEARVHGEDKQHLIFHELGAMDTIGDLIGSSIAFSSIHPDIVICTPISVGSGYVKTEHGLMPVPAPATLEILLSRSHSLHT